MARIYTRTGDSGTTSLVDGTRLSKNSTRIEAYGTVDELNSLIGCVIASTLIEAADKAMLTSIQNRLFDIGSYLAAGSEEMAARLLPPLDGPIAEMEREIDRIEATLPRHNRFILPQGTPACAAANTARAVARRAERRILDFAATAPTDGSILRYINRLSDYLFVLSRHFNNIAGIEEIFWEPLPKT